MENIQIEVAAHGAELRRLVKDGRDYMWNADKAFWGRVSPMLFPVVGKPADEKLRIGGKEYEMHQHGFARDMHFVCDIEEDRHLSFVTRADKESFERWPFDFELRIDYRLLRNVLTVEWQVTNHSSDTMFFQIGAHPGFNYKNYNPDDDLHGYLSFDVESPLVSTVIAPGGYADSETFDVEIPADNLLPLTNETFKCDTIVDATKRIKRITLHDKNTHPIVTVRHSMPITAMWSPCDGRAPFMCIEPWHGCCDPVGFADDIRRKPFTERVEPNETWSTHYEIIVE